ncbi:MAG: outer membrane protein transport protein, partial [Kiritimatiellaeota bacterium]|nr:outer membrane protein transport protein [Kiritimatiellota bacterium]
MKRIQLMAAVAMGGVLAYEATAAGFSIYEASARGNAVGGALVGRTGDASANYYNPANLTELDGTGIMFGATIIRPEAKVDYGATGSKTAMKKQSFYVPHLYASQQLCDRAWLGLGLYSEYGLGTEYPATWVGAADSQKTDLLTVTVNPNIAVKLCDEVSIAAGLRVMYLDILIRKNVVAPTPMPGIA